jgi:N12 class adenine-specific DNA methylase
MITTRTPTDDVIDAPPPKPPATNRRKSRSNSRQWLWQEDERRERLVRKYNDEFNQHPAAHV